MTVKAWQDGPAPTAAETSQAEIDTRAPFQSVKAAVSLFRVAGSPNASLVAKRSAVDERVLEKETQHLLILKELDFYKQQLRNAETGKAQALQELHKANLTFQELTNKLEKLSESRQASIMAAEAAKKRVVELEKERLTRPHALETQKQLHKNCVAELVAAKQELENMRRDFDTAMAEKLALIRRSEDVELAGEERRQRRRQLAEEVRDPGEKLDQENLAVQTARSEHEKAMAGKEARCFSLKSAMEEAETKIKRLEEEERDSESDLEEKIQQVDNEIFVLKQELAEERAKDLQSLESEISVLEKCKEFLCEVIEEESCLRSSLRTAEDELLTVKRQRSEAEKATVELESALEKMQVELQSAIDPLLSKILAETMEAQAEAETSNKQAEALKLEARAATMAAEETEEKLNETLTEGESAKKRSDEAASKVSESNKITISKEAFRSLTNKMKEIKNQADERQAAAEAEAEAIRARVKQISERIEMIRKESVAMKSSADEALKKAEMAEAAKRAVETELQKWRLKEKKIIS